MKNGFETFWGYPRPDGQVGVRNYIAIIYTVDCARFVSEQVASKLRNGISLGWFNCYTMPNNEDADVLIGLGRNPNVGAAVILGLGCEGASPSRVADGIAKSGKEVEVMTIQNSGGTKKSIEKCTRVAGGLLKKLPTERKEYDLSNLTVGLKCGGSDGNSGLSANPLVGLVADHIVDEGGRVLSSELTELAGCDHILRRRATTPELGEHVTRLIKASVGEFEVRFGSEHTMMAPGNVRGGLTTIEEKSLGALMKTGHSALRGILQPGEYPKQPGWHIVDGLVAKNIRHYGLEADGEPTDYAASGAQITLFTTGRGSADGNIVSPLIKVCANPETYRNMRDDMDYDAGAILEGRTTFETAREQLLAKLIQVASGRKSKSELLGHREGGIILGGAALPRVPLDFCP